MTTTSISVRARFIAAAVSLLLLVGAQMFGAAPKAMAASTVSISATIITAGTSVTDINVTLQKYASASGMVVGSGTTTGVSGVGVRLYDAGSVSQDAAYTTSMSANGSWILANIVPGTYKLKYDAAGTHFMTLW